MTAQQQAASAIQMMLDVIPSYFAHAATCPCTICAAINAGENALARIEAESEKESGLLAAMEFAFFSTRYIVGIDPAMDARLTAARDRLNTAMTSAGHDWQANDPSKQPAEPPVTEAPTDFLFPNEIRYEL